jgi:hypothetical protein
MSIDQTFGNYSNGAAFEPQFLNQNAEFDQVAQGTAEWGQGDLDALNIETKFVWIPDP